ncbi:transposase [Trichonephila clavipes]|uniref:Transposase n=1 Tax=Trichonephila clavipes TaxID=2585209 RepID=A0A8X6REZ1_TRICX|nr:transposase [Trichonephila clavipes]
MKVEGNGHTMLKTMRPVHGDNPYHWHFCRICGREVTCPPCRPKVAGSIPYSRFPGRENHRHAFRLIMCHVKDHLSINLAQRILFSDEAHLWLNGYVNKQNCRIWTEANPQVYVETPLHPEKLTVWCALWAGGILLQKRGRPQRYSQWSCGSNKTAQHVTARATIDLLKDTFGDRLISSFGPVNWPPRSCDLTPLDYFLWGYVK